jgi:predicted dehydrogenase
MAAGVITPQRLISHRVPIDDASRAYEILLGAERSLGIVLEYPSRADEELNLPARIIARRPTEVVAATAARVAFIGAGNYAVRTLLPALAKAGAEFGTIVSTGGASAATAAGRFGFAKIASDVDAVFSDQSIKTVFVATRHDSHAALALRALHAGKHVFVEKPLALTESDLDSLETAASGSGALITVGFNRRFAPITREVQREVAGRSGPLAIIATVNAGALPKDHWTQDLRAGGGRIVGEACHWLDLARAIVGEPIADAKVMAARERNGELIEDIAHISVSFTDGSTAAIHYLANGASDYPKERIECFFDGRTLAIDNWRRLIRFGGRSSWLVPRHKMDKGHAAEVRAWMDAVSGRSGPPIPLDELFEVSRWAIRIAQLVRAD